MIIQISSSLVQIDGHLDVGVCHAFDEVSVILLKMNRTAFAVQI